MNIVAEHLPHRSEPLVCSCAFFSNTEYHRFPLFCIQLHRKLSNEQERIYYKMRIQKTVRHMHAVSTLRYLLSRGRVWLFKIA